MNLLMFAGAGTSTELAVPSMRSMAVEVYEHLSRTGTAGRLHEHLSEQLGNPSYDVEELIDALDHICLAEEAITAFSGAPIEPELLQAASVARSEIEWFVQSACERVRPEDAGLLWTPLLKTANTHEVTIATTNYDRAIEIAAAGLRIQLDDGFADFRGREWSHWRGLGVADSSTRLIKLHGSTDWYRVEGAGDVVKLRHPMPLFGGVTLQLSGETPGTLGGALVLPSREKLKNLPPFPDLSHELYGAAQNADVAIFIGSSMRDPDIRGLCKTLTERGSATLVVGLGLKSEPDGAVPANATVFDQHSSVFLTSTLPRLLGSGDLSPDAVRTAAAECSQMESEPILQQLRMVASGDSAEADKSKAIEALWRARVSVDESLIADLMGDGRGTIALDALGLIPKAANANALLERAKSLASGGADDAFQAEVDLLRRVMDDED